MTTIEVFTPAELKERNPEAYDKLLSDWADSVSQDQAPWSDETMDSLEAVIEACDATLKDWSIGAYGQSHISVDVDDDAWTVASFRREVLKPLGYTRKNGHAYFPGLCAFTGYCADDDFLESVYKSLASGSTMTEALEGLASDAERMMEADLEQQQGEESMLANWEGTQFTIDGVMV